MATIYTQPDPYQGWSATNPFANYTAHMLMTDTSSGWLCVHVTPWFRRYYRTQH